MFLLPLALCNVINPTLVNEFDLVPHGGGYAMSPALGLGIPTPTHTTTTNTTG